MAHSPLVFGALIGRVRRRRRVAAVGAAAMSVVMTPALVAGFAPTMLSRADAHPGAPLQELRVVANVGGERGQLAASRCPWARPGALVHATPSQLANEVIAKMTLLEKLGIVDLAAKGGYENVTAAIPSLCIPRLTMQDGPNGIAFGDEGVTQLPSSLGVAASFDTSLAEAYGEVIGEEARAQGIDVVQGPNLNIDRVPESGRTFEGYGEDPTLVSEMGVADITGIQKERVMADAKHFSAYTQETDRIHLDQVIDPRALEEVYLAPFKAAVEQGHVASLMCAYGEINGVYTCEDRSLLEGALNSWSFGGFVRSDLNAVPKGQAARAFAAGLDLIKAGSPANIALALSHHTLSIARLDDAVRRVLALMFIYGLIEAPRPARANTDVATPAHARFAEKAAAESMVLLKNEGGLLPLARRASSIAVIGNDAAAGAMTAGFGGAHVVAPFVITPLAGIRATVSRGSDVVYSPGVSELAELPTIPARELSNVSEHHARGALFAHQSIAPVSLSSVATGSFSLSSPSLADNWQATLKVPMSGIYDFSLTDPGNAWLAIDGATKIANRGVRGNATWEVAAELVAHRAYHLEMVWSVGNRLAPRLGLAYESALIDNAVTLARHANVAVIFVNDYSSEAFDRPNLTLPGAQDALISAVAAANPRTVVVLNTGGAVLMPWLSKVESVLEAWYPGEEDGNATASVLFGATDPSGRLPVTFPASMAETPDHAETSWPGIAGVVHYDEGLDVGYRYDEVHHLTPLFPFGFGLSYTSFSVGSLGISPSLASASALVTNTGSVAGADVVECYLSSPPAAGEPPERLVGFARVNLAPGQTKPVTIPFDTATFASFIDNRFEVVPGNYTISLGSSLQALRLSATVSLVASTTGASGALPLGLSGVSGALPFGLSGVSGASFGLNGISATELGATS